MRFFGVKGLSRVVAVIIILLVLVVAAGGVYYYLFTKPPSKRTSLIYGSTYDFDTLDPTLCLGINSIIMNNVYDNLVWYDSRTDRLIPGLATSWDRNEDGTRWVFHLRKGVTFHDGTPFNATAVKYSIDRSIEGPLAGMGGAYIWALVSEVRIIDDYTVELVLSSPARIDVVATSTYAAEIMSPSAPNTSEWFDAGHESGSGPYKLTSYNPSAKAVLEKYEDWWGWKESNYPRASPNAPEIYIITIVRDYVALEQQIVAGDIDVTQWVPIEDVATLKSNPKLQVYEVPTFQTLYVWFNTRKPPLDNLLVREAIAHAIDYESVAQVATAGLSPVGSGVLPHGYPAHSEEFRYEYSPSKARELLAEAGYPNGGFKLELVYITGDTFEKKSAEVIGANLAPLGIEVDIHAMTNNERWARCASGWDNPSAVQDMNMGYWWPTYITPYDFLVSLYRDGGTKNMYDSSYFSDPAFDAIIDEALTAEATDYDKALELYRQAQRIIYDQVPGIALWDLVQPLVARQGIGNLERAVDPAYPTVLFAQVLSIETPSASLEIGALALAQLCQSPKLPQVIRAQYD